MPSIEQAHERELYSYIYNICTKNRCVVHRIGGMPDHIHILLFIPPTIALSDLVRDIKAKSSLWIRENKKFPMFYRWGQEYAAFTYAYSDLKTVKNYIKNQKEHHKHTSLRDEYLSLLKEYAQEDKIDYLLKD